MRMWENIIKVIFISWVKDKYIQSISFNRNSIQET
jgi:hypothetical protein